MDFQQLKIFQTVAKHGNMSKAARELFVTQPSLSKSISRLENELGVPLFTHRKGKVELNDYGKIFLESIESSFFVLQNGIDRIQQMYETDAHILSLTSNISGFLPDTLPGFCNLHPEIGIRQFDASTQQMIEQLLDHTTTLGISCEYINNEQLEFIQLGSKEFVLIVSRSHPLAINNSVRIEQLKNEIFICDTSRLRIEPLRKLCLAKGFTPNIGFEIENIELIYNLVENNRGIVILPLGLSAKLMHQHPDNNIKLLRINADLAPTIIGVAYHRNYELSDSAQLYIDYLKQTLKEEEELIKSYALDIN